jgi:glycerol dehydrogenase-like iron-containing ADH family enzyme
LIRSQAAEPLRAGSEHLFAWNLEAVTGRDFLHGEAVALGLVIASFLQKNAVDRVKAALREARVAYLPDQIGASWEEVTEALTSVQAYNDRFRHLQTVYDGIRWDRPLLDEVRRVVHD